MVIHSPVSGAKPASTAASAKLKPAPAAREEAAAAAAGRARVVIENVQPEIDAGRFAAKAVIGDRVRIEADVFCDGHDLPAAVVHYRREDETTWREAPMRLVENDRWRGEIEVKSLGRYRFTVMAWVDRFATWRRDLEKKIKAGQDVATDLLIGAELVEESVGLAEGDDAAHLRSSAQKLRTEPARTMPAETALDERLAALMRRHDPRRFATRHERVLSIDVDRPKARFSAWYELFPRSCTDSPDRHGTLRDVMQRLSAIEELGFDVLYLPPIHPIGRSHRKGRNNTRTAKPDDVGSPWAIGAREGGHKAIHPQLGTFDDFAALVKAANDHGIEIALDIAFQCAPDHPYVEEHPEWFRHRPDGTIQHAENPPKKYEDIVPFDFECEAWQSLWDELASVVEFWIERGVRIFRVDNPHTKPFAFWEWLIARIKAEHPDVLFLSEAFTRPKVMQRLAKLGFSQSYTYFAWKNTKRELESYFTELTRPPVRDFFRPNVWPNTPDILNEYLQTGGRSAFMIRLILAATLASNYGIYGPAFELCAGTPVRPGSEEYLDSEKYQIRKWNLDDPNSLAALITRLNAIRREHMALQSDHSLRFHRTDNEHLICYSKRTADFDDVIVTVVNVDAHRRHSGHIHLDLKELGVEAEQAYQMHDLIGDARFAWEGSRQFVELDPGVMPAHVLKLRRRVRTERDFDYFM